MSTVTISKKEYDRLTEAKLRFDYMRRLIESSPFSPPPTRSRREAIAAFRATGRYNRKFLASMGRALGRSSHFSRA